MDATPYVKLTNGSAYQFPKRVILADVNILFNAAGTFPEKAGRTEAQKEGIKSIYLWMW